MIYFLFMFAVGIVHAENASKSITNHPLYPIALEHVLRDENQGRLPGLEWDSISDQQRVKVRAELQSLVREAETIEGHIRFIESLIGHYSGSTFSEPPSRLRHLSENRDFDHFTTPLSEAMLPQNRLQYLKRIAASLAFVARQSKLQPDKMLELKAMAARLLLEAEWTIISTKGSSEQVARDATTTWAVILMTSLAADGILSYLHFWPTSVSAIAAVAASSMVFAWNVSARDLTSLRPILFLPGAYRRSANNVALRLRKIFWIEVEVDLLNHGFLKNDFDGNFESEDLPQTIQAIGAGNLLDLRTFDCGSILRHSAQP